MVILQIAAYAFVVFAVLFLALKVFWLAFLFFSFRFWNAVLTYEAVNSFIPLHVGIYFVLLVFLTIGTYLLTNIIKRKVPFSEYVILFVLVLFVFRRFELVEIFFFKDYLLEAGMWGSEFWKRELQALFSSSVDEKTTVLEGVWFEVKKTMVALWTFLTGNS